LREGTDEFFHLSILLFALFHVAVTKRTNINYVIPNLFRDPTGQADACLVCDLHVADLSIADLYDGVLKQVQHDVFLFVTVNNCFRPPPCASRHPLYLQPKLLRCLLRLLIPRIRVTEYSHGRIIIQYSFQTPCRSLCTIGYYYHSRML